MPKTKSHPIRFSDEQKARIAKTAQKVELTFPDTIRKAIDFGLPVLEARMTRTEMKL